MMNQQTIDKLKEMKLLGLLAAWTEQQTQPTTTELPALR